MDAHPLRLHLLTQIAAALGLAGLLAMPAPAPAQWLRDGFPLCNVPGDQFSPLVVPGGSVIWLDRREGRQRSAIYMANLEFYEWLFEPHPSLGTPVFTGAGDASLPRAIPYAENTVLVTWSDDRNGNRNRDVFVQRLTRGGEVWPSFVWDGIPTCSAPGAQVDPSVADDGAGGFFVAWTDGRADSVSGSDIYLQHYYESGGVWEGWPPNGMPVCSAPDDQAEPVLVPDASGGAIVIWRDRRSGGSDLYARGIRPNGSSDANWGVDGIAICDAPGEQEHHVILPDGAGGAYMAWSDGREEGGAVLYVLRITSFGAPAAGWATDGIPLSWPTDFSDTPALCLADSGGIYVAWNRYQKPSSAVQVQRLHPDGSLVAGWPFGGRQAGQGAVFDVSPAVLGDGADGVFVAWSDPYGNSIDVRAQRLKRDGNRAEHWPQGGVVLSEAPNEQILPEWRSSGTPGGAILPDGFGGIIVPWTDTRVSSDLDLYIQRVTKNAVVAPERPPCFFECAPEYLAAVYPNPTRGAVSAKAWAWREDQTAWFEVFDIRGRRVREVTRSNIPAPAWFTQRLDLSGLPAGVYFVGYGSKTPGGRGLLGRKRIVLLR